MEGYVFQLASILKMEKGEKKYLDSFKFWSLVNRLKSKDSFTTISYNVLNHTSSFPERKNENKTLAFSQATQ